jgi:hypothetical protein
MFQLTKAGRTLGITICDTFEARGTTRSTEEAANRFLNVYGVSHR